MLSYQHIYHAGNFADVHKHAILVQLLKTLRAKNPKLPVLDTHAGRGAYDLTGEEALKTNEAVTGAHHYWGMKALPPGLREIVEKLNPEGELKTWPGSAAIARDGLRAGEKLIAYEKHPGEFEELQRTLPANAQVELHKADGLEAMLELCPLPGRKGLVVIDPSYEVKTEYAQVARHVHLAWKKWPQGVFLIWYPMLEAQGHKQLLTGLRKSAVKDVMVSELRLDKPLADNQRMTGTGIAIINPPWPQDVLDSLTQKIAAAMPVKTWGEVFWLDNQQIDPETGLVGT
jgi:23S rRNA (adenine2030-N6)-methyltransferase